MHSGGVPGAFTIGATTPAQIRRSEALLAVQERVAAKDLAGTDLLIMTCGLPNEFGYMCPLDQWLFQHLRDRSIQKQPSHFERPYTRV